MRARSESDFILVEFLTAILIMGTFAGIVIPVWQCTMSAREADSGANQLVSDL